MTRTGLARLAALLLLPALGCDRLAGLDGAEVPAFATLRGTVTATVAPRGARLRVGVLWAGVPAFVPYCHLVGRTALDPERVVPPLAALACRDPFGVVPAAAGPSVPITLESGRATFELPLRALPPASLMVGAPDGRVAYGAVIVFDDRDGDDAFSIWPRCRGFRGRGTGAPSDEAPADGEVQDQILASTFARLTEPQLRLTYVEGNPPAQSTWYPHPDCTRRPGPGFSLWSVGDYLGPRDTCAVEPPETPLALVVPPRGADFRDLSCPTRARETFPREPELDDFTRGNLLIDCLPDGTIVTTSRSCVCPEVRAYPLAGCFDELDCAVPDWDFRTQIPEWWPCR